MTNDSIAIMSRAGFIDHVNDNHGGTHDYSVTAFVVKFAPEVLNKYNDIFNYIDDPAVFDIDDYEERCHNRRIIQQHFKNWICGLLGISSEGVTITQNVSEIFTVVQIVPTKGE